KPNSLYPFYTFTNSSLFFSSTYTNSPDLPSFPTRRSSDLLPFPNCSFDAAVCQFGVMFVPDKAAAMRESFRVLRSGGVFLLNVWDSFKANPFAQIAHTTICSFFDHDPPGFYKIPFGFHDSTVIRGMLQDTGFDKIESFSEM